MLVTTKNLEETYKLAKSFIESVQRPDLRNYKRSGLGVSGAIVVLLEGDLGSGKTSFVQGVAKALGVNKPVTSPTFVIQKIYQLYPRSDLGNSKGPTFTNLVHIDAYRLEGAYDLELIKWQELITDPTKIIVVEWPEKVWLSGYPTIKFKFIDENTRTLDIPELS